MSRTVIRSRLNITLYENFLSCYFCFKYSKQIILQWLQYLVLSTTALPNLLHNDKDSQCSHTYSEWVFVNVCFQHEMHVHHIGICDLFRYTEFFHVFSYKAGFSKNVIGKYIFISIFSTRPFWSISLSRKNWEIYDQKWILIFTYSTSFSCYIVMKFEFSEQFLKNK